MNPLRVLTACAVGLLCCVASTRGTTVIPPNLDELVERSEIVIQTRVLSSHSAWRGTGEERCIVTTVTYAVDDTIVGAPQSTLELEFLGGEVDGERMFVVGQTRFAPGQRDILFVSRDRSAITPLVRMMYGRYLVADRDDGTRIVARADGTPLLALDQIPAPIGKMPSGEALALMLDAGPLTPEGFSDAIRESARRLGRTDASATSAPPAVQ